MGKKKCFLSILIGIFLSVLLIACGKSRPVGEYASPDEVTSEPIGSIPYVNDESSESESIIPTTDSTYKKPVLDIENLVAMEPLTDPNARRFVYIPASYFGVSDLYGQEAVWGYMNGEEPALAIIHVEDGDISATLSSDEFRFWLKFSDFLHIIWLSRWADLSIKILKEVLTWLHQAFFIMLR